MKIGDIEAEIAALAVCFVNYDALHVVMAELEPEDFLNLAHKLIFQAIMRAYAKDPQQVEHVFIYNELKESGDLAAIGGVEYIARVTEYTPMAEDVNAYIKLVKQESQRRKLHAVGERLQKAAADPSEEPETLAGKAIEYLINKLPSKDLPFRRSIVTEGREWRADLRHREENASDYPGWAWKSLRDKLGPWLEQELIIVGAATHTGKSTFLMQNLCHNAVNGIPAAFFALEMTRKIIEPRLVAFLLGKSLHAASQSEILACEEMLDASPVYVDDTRMLTLQAIISRIRVMHSLYAIKVAYIDHIGLVKHTSKRTRTRNDEIGEITSELAGLAQDLKIDIVIASQFSREAKKLGRPPIEQDLRDSGNLEQDGDTILLLSFPHEYAKEHENPDLQQVFEEEVDPYGGTKVIKASLVVDIKKRRNGGQRGKVPLYWDWSKGKGMICDNLGAAL